MAVTCCMHAMLDRCLNPTHHLIGSDSHPGDKHLGCYCRWALKLTCLLAFILSLCPSSYCKNICIFSRSQTACSRQLRWPEKLLQAKQKTEDETCRIHRRQRKGILNPKRTCESYKCFYNEACVFWQPPEMALASDLDLGECYLPIKCYGEIPSVFFKTNTKCQCGFP